MAEDRIPSPEGQKDPTEDDTLSENSPTRVLDFDEAAAEASANHGDSSRFQGDSPSLVELSDAPVGDTIFREVSMLNIPAKSSRQSFSALPTLDETSSSEDDVEINMSFDDLPAAAATSPVKSPIRRQRESIGPLIGKEQMSKQLQTRKLFGSSQRMAGHREQVQELQAKAAALAQTGQEVKALAVYKQALKMTKADINRIKAQLQQAHGKHPDALQSIQSRLHEDWMNVGLTIAKIRTMMAILRERMGDYERAIACCQEARDVYKRQAAFCSRPDFCGNKTVNIDVMVEQTTVMMKKMELASSSFEERKRMHEEFVVLRRRLAVTNDPDSRDILFSRLEGLAYRARKLEVDLLGETHPQVAETLALLSDLALEQNDREQALEHITAALEIDRVSLGGKHPRTGQDLLQIARIYVNQLSDRVDEDRAIDYYNQAIDVFRQSGSCPRLLGSTLNDVAVIHIRRRDFELASQLLSDALESYQTRDGEFCSDTVQIWRNLGECYSQRKEYENAANAFSGALDVQRDARKIHDAATEGELDNNVEDVPPLHLVDDESIADTLRRLGKARFFMGEHKKALAAYKEALVIHRAAVAQAVKLAKGRSNVSLPDKQDQLAHTVFCIAEVTDALGKTKAAVRFYSESLQLRLFSDAHKQDKRSNMVHCAMCLTGIGNAHMKNKEYDEAQKVYKDALGYCEAHGIAECRLIVAMIRKKIKDAERREHRTDEGLSEAARLELKADAEIAGGDLDRAVQTLSRVMTVRKASLKQLKASKLDPSNEQYATACTLEKFGSILAKKRDIPNAERAYQDALKLLRKSGMDSSSLRVQDIESELKRLQTPTERIIL